MNREKFIRDTHAMLEAQGGFAIRGTTCFYRDAEGKKCAIGLHIPEELYRMGMEGSGITSLFTSFPRVEEVFEKKYGVISTDDQYFLGVVQRTMHDYPAQMGEKLSSLEDCLKLI